MDNRLSVTSASINLDANAVAFALARNECGEKLPLADVLQALGLDTKSVAVRNLLTSEMFKAQCASYVRELKETGESFRLKARVQAEELLRTHWALIHDTEAPHTVRMKGIENVVEWADLKPKKVTEQAAPPAISIHIDLSAGNPGNTQAHVIDITPEDTKNAAIVQRPADTSPVPSE